MKRKGKRKKYRAVKAFFCTFAVCILFAATISGIAVVYVRTEKLRTGEVKPAFSVVRGENGVCTVTVMGKEGSVLLPGERTMTALEYALIPPEVRTLWQGILYLSEQTVPEEEPISEKPDPVPADTP